MLQITVPFSIAPSAVLFGLQIKSEWTCLSSNRMHPKLEFQRYLAIVQWHMVHPKLKWINQLSTSFVNLTECVYLPSWLMGCDQANDLNTLLLLSWASATWSLCILPLVALESGKIDFFGSTAMRNSSFTTANKSFITAMHGSMVFEELVGNSSIFLGRSADICK